MNILKSPKTVAAALAIALAGSLSFLAAPASADDWDGIYRYPSGTYTQPPTDCSVGANLYIDELAIAYGAEEAEMVALINEFRVQNGVPALVDTYALTRPASWASTDSAVRGYSPSDHIDTLDRDIPTRLHECGYTGNFVAEINYNKWGGDVDDSYTDAFYWWTEVSPTLGLMHRDILLDPTFTAVGVAKAYNGERAQPADTNRVHWTVTFGDTI